MLKYVEVTENLHKLQDKNNKCIFCNLFSRNLSRTPINAFSPTVVYDTQEEENRFLQPSVELHYVPIMPKYMDSEENDYTWLYRTSVIFHENARSHTAADVTDLLRCCRWGILEHPPYSPDMNPCDYDLFAKMKEPLRGTRYNTRDEFIRAKGRSIRKSTKVDALIVYDAFQIFGKRS